MICLDNVMLDYKVEEMEEGISVLKEKIKELEEMLKEEQKMQKVELTMNDCNVGDEKEDKDFNNYSFVNPMSDAEESRKDMEIMQRQLTHVKEVNETLCNDDVSL